MVVRTPASSLALGDVVHVRSKQWIVEDIEEPTNRDRMTLVSLSCMELDSPGESLQVIWEAEVDARKVNARTWSAEADKRFDDAALFGAYYYAMRWSSVSTHKFKSFQAPYRAGIDVMKYQLEPLSKALDMPRVNLFIADDVGLGKTIEAGLIVRELLIRQRIKRIVVLAPPSVVLQWKQEMLMRFGLDFEIYDRDFIKQKRREFGWATNPFSTHTRFILSHAMLRDERHAGPLRDWLGTFSQGSLLIFDEAHHAAPASGTKHYAVDSKLTRTVRQVVNRFEHRLFLSATPHNGHSNSFSALLELLDPQRFTRGTPISGEKELEEVMVRRLKSDLREHAAASFPKREVIEIELDGLDDDAPELELSNLLESYRSLRHAQAKQGALNARQRSAFKLVHLSMQKRLTSSIAAFWKTLNVHKASLDRKRSTANTRASLDALNAQLELADELTAQEREKIEERQVDLLGQLDTSQEIDDVLSEMLSIAQKHRGRPDAKLNNLIDWIRRHMCPDLPEGLHEHHTSEASWTDKRVIIFTEYMDTLRYIQQQLGGLVSGTHKGNERIGIYHGGLGEDSRERLKQAFNAKPSAHPLRILIATDAAREGVNFQNHCSDLFHYDIPWNPARMEQRNGRIDRKLQREPIVYCRYFVYPQRAEDRVLKAVVRKTEIIQRELGSLSAVVMNQVNQLLEQGIDHTNVDTQCDTIQAIELSNSQRDVVERELEAARSRAKKLEASLEKLTSALQRSERELGFDVHLFRLVIDQALGLLGLAALRQVDGAREIYEFPDLEDKMGKDPSWRATLDTLRPARAPGEFEWDWRKRARLRPVIFRDAGELDADHVHLHLEHPLVKRLLAQFYSQGFGEHSLSRVCILPSSEATPRVVLLGRLSLYGEGASRLHHDLIPITARWHKGQPLTPYKDTAEATTLKQLDQSFRDNAHLPVPSTVHKQYASQLEADLGSLIPYLEQRAAEEADHAREILHERAEKEATSMINILERQRHKIHNEQDNAQQTELIFSPKEKKQFAANQAHWTARLEQIEQELVDEPARIRANYEVTLERIEPVGIIYLWPISG